MAGRRGLHAGLDLVQRAGQTVGLHRLHEVVDRVDLKGLERVLAVCRDEDHRGRVLQLVQCLGQLHARRLGHGNVKEQHVTTLVVVLLDVNQMLDRVAGACDFFDGLDTTGLFKKEAQFRASRSLVINNQGMQHVSVLVS